MGQMNFRLLRADEMSAELWNGFHALRDARSLYDDPFFDPHYAQLVAGVRPDARIGLAFQGDALVGVWPLHRRPGAWARPIGGPFSDWHGPVLSGDTALTAHAFLKGLGFVGMSTFGWLPQDTESSSRLTMAGANMSDLRDGWDAFLANQNERWPKHFKKMRRLERNMERDFTDVEFRIDDKSDDTFNRLIFLKREQFRRTGRHDVLASDWAQRLIDRMRHFRSDRFRLRLVSLHLDGNHAASELVIQSDKIVHGWLTAYEASAAQYSPGNFVVQNMLEAMAAQTGPKIYDAGPGLDHYKRHYSNFQLPIGSGVVRAKTIAIRPERLFGQAWRSGELHLDSRLSEVMKSARRRLDQVCISEIRPAGRLVGIGKAFGRAAAALELADSDASS